LDLAGPSAAQPNHYEIAAVKVQGARNSPPAPRWRYGATVYWKT